MKWLEMRQDDNDGPSKIIVTHNGEKEERTVSPKEIWLKDLKLKMVATAFLSKTLQERQSMQLLVKRCSTISDAAPEEKGLAMKVDYVTMDLNRFDNKNIPQGSDFMMIVKVSNNLFRVWKILHLQMVPSGWEIRNTRLFELNTG